MAKLTEKERDDLPRSAFALPEKREYPIHDLEHARMALAMLHNATPEEQDKIKRAVHNRFPQIAIEDMREDVQHSLDENKDT